MKKITDKIKHEFNSTYFGKVEDNNDPNNMGRLKIRVFNLHSEDLDKTKLPWFIPAYPITASQTGAVGDSGIPEIGSVVVVQFIEGNIEQGIYTHTIPGSNNNGLPNQNDYKTHRQIKTPFGQTIDIQNKDITITENETSTIIQIKDGIVNIKSKSKISLQAPEINVEDSNGNDVSFLINDVEFLKLFMLHSHATGVGPSGGVLPLKASIDGNTKWYTKSLKIKK